MTEDLRLCCFEAARNVAGCPHLATCRSEMTRIGKEMPLRLPSPHYVGTRYRGLVIIAGNPGIAHAGIHHQNDALMFALQEKVATGDQKAFEQLGSGPVKSLAEARIS